MKLCYLNPSYEDFSLERQLLLGTHIKLISASVHGPEQIIQAVKDADAILTVTDPITAAVADTLERCRVIVRLGVGYDIVDLAACRRRGIVVCNVPDYGTEEVAVHALALCFAVLRHLLFYDRNVRAGRWSQTPPGPSPRVSNLRAGVLGLGRIGTAFAKGIRPFVREVIAFDPFVSSEQFLVKEIAQAGLTEIFETCDIISLHLPLLPENHHLIAEAAIAQMQRKPILINVSRGGLVDSAALLRALQSGQISGAGLDVFEDEPNVAGELLGLENVVLSPHMAWYSDESDLQLRRSAIEEILRVLSGQAPRNPVN